jgi:hypothetical protein
MKKLYFLLVGVVLYSMAIAQTGLDCSDPKTALQGMNAAEGHYEEWFSYTVSKDSALITIHTCGLSNLNDLELVVYLNDCVNEVAYDYWGMCGAGQPKVTLKAKAGDVLYIYWDNFDEKQFGFEILEQAYVVPEGVTCNNPKKAYEGINQANDYGRLFKSNYFTYTLPENGNITLKLKDHENPYYYGDIDEGGFAVFKNPVECASQDPYDMFYSNPLMTFGKNITISAQKDEELMFVIPEIYEPFEWELSYTPGTPIEGLSCSNAIPFEAPGNYTADFSKHGNPVQFFEYTPSADTAIMFTSDDIGQTIWMGMHESCLILDLDDGIEYTDGDTAYALLRKGTNYKFSVVIDDFYEEPQLVDTAIYEFNVSFVSPEQFGVSSDYNPCDSITDVTPGIHKADNSYGNDIFRFAAPDTGILYISSCNMTEEDTYLTLMDECNGNSIISNDDYCDVQSEILYTCSAGDTVYINWEDEYTDQSFQWELKFIASTDFINFTIDGAEKASIDYTNHTITIPAHYYLDVTSTYPHFDVLDGSIVKIGTEVQESGMNEVDFTNPVTYNVNGQDWVVSIVQNATPSSEKEILSLEFEAQKSTPVIMNDSLFQVELVNTGDYYGFSYTLSDFATLLDEEMNKLPNPAELSFIPDEDTVSVLTYVMAEDSTTKEWWIEAIRFNPDSGTVCNVAYPAELGQNIFSGAVYDTWYMYVPSKSGVLKVYDLNYINTEFIELHVYRNSCEYGDDEYHDFFSAEDTAMILTNESEPLYFAFDEDVTHFTLEESTQLSTKKWVERVDLRNIDEESSDINTDTRTVDLLVGYETDITNVEIYMEVNEGALIKYDGDTLNARDDNWGYIYDVDLTSPMYFNLIAMDGSQATWTIKTTKKLPATGTDILSFGFLQQIVPAQIDKTNHQATAYLYPDADLTKQRPFFSLSEGATAYVNNQKQYNAVTANDFSTPVTYTIKAQDGTMQEWIVEAIKADDSDADILSYQVNRQVGPADIDFDQKTVQITVAYETDLSSVTPDFTLSPGAVCKVEGIEQESGVTAVDFTSKQINYDVIAKDNSSQTWTISVVRNLPVPAICMVTVDSLTGKNLIVWEKMSHDAIDHYNIYKENASAQWEQIGEVSPDEITVFEDVNSNPEIQAEKYKIAIEDNQGEESAHSGYHQTIHLNINVATGGGSNLIWNHYMDENNGVAFGDKGSGSYYIYRGTSPDNLELFHTLSKSNTSYTDPADTSTLYYYQIAVSKNNACNPAAITKASGGPFSRSVSNLEDNRLKEQSIKEIDPNKANINIYPNPFRDYINVNYTLTDRVSVKLELYDMTGKPIKQILNGVQNAGNHSCNFSVREDNLNKGVYLLKVNLDNYVYWYKLVMLK